MVVKQGVSMSLRQSLRRIRGACGSPLIYAIKNEDKKAVMFIVSGCVMQTTLSQPHQKQECFAVTGKLPISRLIQDGTFARLKRRLKTSLRIV